METDSFKRTHATTGAVMTTFRPPPGLAARVDKVRGAVARVIVVDDSGSDEVRAELHHLLGHLDCVDLLHHESNLGIAAALNTGVRRALDYQFTHVLLLDDDTDLEPSTVLSMLAAFGEQHIPPIAIIGLHHDSSRSRALTRIRGTRIFCSASSVITAGTLIASEAYRSIGPFREDFYIDYVDHEYCLRARKRGFRILATIDGDAVTPIGSRHRSTWLTFSSVHSPERTYYFFRNSIIVLLEYARYFPAFALWTIMQQLKTLAKMSLIPRTKRQYWCAAYRGCSDALRRRMGKQGDNSPLHT